MQREKPGPSLGLPCSNGSGFRVGALPSAKLTGRPLWCPVTQQPTTKTPLQGILGERQRTRRKWGMGRELSETRVWPRPYFPAIKAPSFPRASVRAQDTEGPRRKRGKWRARPLDHTGKAFFLSSGGSGMSPSWRQDASGPLRKSSPCRNQMGGRKDQGDSNHPEPVDPDDSPFGCGTGTKQGWLSPATFYMGY